MQHEEIIFAEGNGLDKFVLHVPKWQGELIFSKELLIFLGVILFLVIGTLFCFWGYKYFRTILFLAIGAAVCYGSYLLVEPMTTNAVVRMFLTVSLTFLGICFVYFIDIIFGYVLDKLRIRSALGKRSYLLSAPLGAAILGLTVYYFIWRDEIAVGAASAVCLVAGLIFQHVKRKKQVRFRCYGDLLRLERPQFDGDGLEYIAAESEPELIPVIPVVTEPEPEPTPAPIPVVPVTVEPEGEPGPEPVPAIPAIVEAEGQPETEADPGSGSDIRVVNLTPQPVFAPELSIELSDEVKNLINRKKESEEELLEDAFFVRRLHEVVERPVSRQRVHTHRKLPAHPGEIAVTGRRGKKLSGKFGKNLAMGAAIAAADVSRFFAEKASKGRD